MKDYIQSLPKEDLKYYLETVDYLQKMRDQREINYKEFDNLTYSQRYDLNRETGLSYTNKDVLVNSNNTGDSITSSFQMTAGGSRNKSKALVSHLLSFNFQCDIRAYDKNNRVVSDLGESTEDLVNRSSVVENWEDKRREVYAEFVDQGNVFVREVYEKCATVIHDNGNWEVGMKISDFVPDKNKVTKFTTTFQRQLILGKNVYLTNIQERNIQKQAKVAVYEEMNWSQARQRFGKWDRWEFVEKTKGMQPASSIDQIVQTDQSTNTLGIFGSDNNYWNIRQPQDSVGILHVYDSVEKTYMIIMNGIMMLPIGYSMYEVSPSGLIPLAKGDAEVLSGFAYSKGNSDAVIIDSKMLDMVYNSIVQKLSQSAKPTMGNNSGKLIPKGILYSGRLIQGIRAGMLEPLLPAESRSITNGDTEGMQLIRQILNDKSVDDAFSGDPVGVKTATEFLERKKNTIMKLFSMVAGLAEFEEQLARLRIASIYSKWTEPEEIPELDQALKNEKGITQYITRKEYKKEIVPTQFKDSGKTGFRDIRFTDSEHMPDVNEMIKEENVLTKKMGKPVRITYLNSEELSRLFEWTWEIDVIQKQQEDDKLDKLTYLDNKMRIANLFGPDVINKEYTLERYAQMDGEQAEKAYNISPTGAMKAQMPQQPQQQPAIKNPVASITNNIQPDEVQI